jgi:hypothetical protein
MLSGVSIICFAASYAVALALEVTRLFFRAGLRLLTIVAFAAAGLVAHTIYLGLEAQAGLSARGAPLSGWYHWSLVAAWVLAAVYLSLALLRPKNPIGLFLLPLVLGLIGVALLFPKSELFPADRAYQAWSMIHGLALLVGTASVLFGFASGLMYLVQSYRLKHKLLPRPGFLLPSLEWLQAASEGSLILSSFLLAGGLLSGIILNLVKHSQRESALPWSDPVVWTSGILLLWLLVVSIFNAVYKPARQGRKVAYLTVASFIFLALVLGIMLSGRTQHAGVKPSSQAAGRWTDQSSQFSSVGIWLRAGEDR